MSFINNVFWFLSSIFDMMCTTVEIAHLQKEIQKQSAKVQNATTQPGESNADEKMKLKDLKANYLKQWLNLFRNIADLPAIFHFMGYTDKWSAELAGTGGTIASMISLYNMWGAK